MKKIITVILAIAMIFSFAACSETEEQVTEVTPARGTVENGIYKNAAFGVSFNAGEGWYFLSDDEIAQAMGVAADKIFGEGTEIEGDNVYDLYCVKDETSATVSINYENLGTVAEFTDENYYLETVMTQLLSTGTENGIVDAVISNIKVSGKEVPCLYIELNYGGMTIYQNVIVKKIGSWIGTVTIASLSESELEELVGTLSFE